MATLSRAAVLRPAQLSSRVALVPMTRPTQLCRVKVLEGKVTSDKMEKTATVEVSRLTMISSKYGKRQQRSKKYHIHDEHNECDLGDVVRIRNGMKTSKTKTFELDSIVRKAEKLQ